MAPTVAAESRAAYDVLVGFHVVCAVVGFGAVAVSGAYGAVGRKVPPRGDANEVNRFFSAPNRAEYLLVAAPMFGIAAMAVRPGGEEYGDLWAIVGYIVWVVASLLLIRVVRPAEARIRAGEAGAAGAARSVMWAAAGCDLLFVVALLVMVMQPT
jgi:hypothetical protein